MVANDHKKSVPFFNYPHVFTSEEKEYVSLFSNVCSRGAFIAQQELREFERNLATFVGCKYAIGMANGTDALIAALRIAGIKSGDEVIFCSHTMVATAAAIHFNNGTPIPIECGFDRLMNVDEIEKAITPRTKMILPTQLNGRTCQMDRILSMAKQHNLAVVEDAAQALGSRYRGQCAGTFGLAGMISFYPAKSLGCFGDGGALITNNQEFYERCLAVRDHGRSTNGEVITWGLNSRLDNLQAAILDHKLKTFPQAIERRRQIASIYHQQLKDVKEVHPPPPPMLEGKHFDTYQNYEIEAQQRDELVAYLSERGIGTLIQWGGKAVHQFKALGFSVKLPYTEAFFTRCVMLPMNTSLSDDDVNYVCSSIKNFYLK